MHRVDYHTIESNSTLPIFISMSTKTTATEKSLQKLGLVRPVDFALHLPLRYEDETRITRLANARAGDVVQIEATVTDAQVQYRARRQLLVTVDDGSGVCVARFFHFYPSQIKALAVGKRILLRGELKTGLVGYTMLHPSFKAAGGDLPESLTPVYPTASKLPQAYLRRAVQSALQRASQAGELNETLPGNALHALHAVLPQPLLSLQNALYYLHQPPPEAAIAALENRNHPAWQRLKAEELLAQQLSQAQAQAQRNRLAAPALPAQKNGLHEQLLTALPFTLTAAQQRVANEIAQDLQYPRPMHRLLQGDVGAGKTVVAALAACICIDAGWQCVLMAPTEILAEQHYRKLLDWLTPLGVGVAWLTGSQKTKARRDMLIRIASGEAQLIIGTHAVMQDKVQFAHLALAIIDEQHRFGVQQRLALRKKMRPIDKTKKTTDGQAAENKQTIEQEPHLLMMTATPIPRTLAMSYYADLQVSTIDQLPPGRTPVLTKLIAQHRRDEIIAHMQQQIQDGQQVYWVCPLIEESETLDLQNATQTHADLCAALPDATVALLHAKLGIDEKKSIMDAFVQGEVNVLVSTTVIEVGVDVPNASLMVIEHAERFGLSQLHQLRGRVGRGAQASVCVLLYAPDESGRVSSTAKDRLRTMRESNDGFVIAQRDLEIRGPGELLGARQSGSPLLRFASLEEDTALIEWAHQWAPDMLQNHPKLAQAHLQRWLGEKTDYLKV